jgi:hypothetical protein
LRVSESPGEISPLSETITLPVFAGKVVRVAADAIELINVTRGRAKVETTLFIGIPKPETSWPRQFRRELSQKCPSYSSTILDISVQSGREKWRFAITAGPRTGAEPQSTANCDSVPTAAGTAAKSWNFLTPSHGPPSNSKSRTRGSVLVPNAVPAPSANELSHPADGV